MQSKANSDINEYQSKLENALNVGKANIVYNSINTESAESHIYNIQEWSAWNDKRYINKYTEIYYGIDTNTIFLCEPSLYRQNVYKELKYYLYMQDDPDNHFWDLYAK